MSVSGPSVAADSVVAVVKHLIFSCRKRDNFAPKLLSSCELSSASAKPISALYMLTLVLHPLAFRAAGIRPRTAPAAGAISMAEPKCTVIFLRHGQSVWNEANLFTGWADVELTTLGKNEAAMGATEMWRAGLSIDVAYTSRLKRAQQTLDIVLRITGQEDTPTHKCWRLNERMYGALTGLDKKETVAKYGEDQVKLWRRSYDVPPPEIDTGSEYWPGNANEYAHIEEDDLPRSECLKDCVERTVPYWEQEIVPALMRGKTVLVAAHGNSIRGILKHIDGISDEDITGLEIPTGIPLVYQLDDDLKPIKSDRATGVLSGHFLANQEALAAAQQKVADQTKVADG